MKPRRCKDVARALVKKGFCLDPDKQHHQFYFLEVGGRREPIYTYLSHGTNEYGANLMSMIKRQLRFTDSADAEKFFDCAMSGDDYLAMLKKDGVI
jgi:hypothetical protein